MSSKSAIPFGRTLRLGAIGRDVLAVKRALSKAGYGRWAKFTALFGPYTVILLRRFQKAHNLAADGQYGPSTHAKLSPFFDKWGVQLYRSFRVIEPTRERIVDAARYFASIEPRVHYTQGSARMMIVRDRLHPPVNSPWNIYEDCSSFATGCYWIAGAPDPNGRGYDGFGYTGTLVNRGKIVSRAQAKPGDLVFYGNGWPWHHVAIYIGSDRVISHGRESGPNNLPIDYRPDRGEIRSYL